ncbi:MAG TPA: response regulator [Candidatus Dormibacteraeota bacterium]|nr:response regulator [Candidatus Dormibacteraeota bacterium]
MREGAVLLLVEDREDDITLIRRSFEKVGICNPIQTVKDGEEAIAYLSGIGEYSDRQEHPLPQLVLLDLKLPKVDGFEVLRWIRTDSQSPDLRVVVLTSSDHIGDVNLAYKLGANSFLVKPSDFKEFVELSSFIADNWSLWVTGLDAQEPIDKPREPTQKLVLLRSRESQYFYGGRAGWVRMKQDAVDFQRIELAEGRDGRTA